MPLVLWLLGFATGGMANVARLAAPVTGFRVQGVGFRVTGYCECSTSFLLLRL
jgi:hypothetical protein